MSSRHLGRRRWIQRVFAAACVVVVFVVASATVERDLTGSEGTVFLAARHVLEHGNARYEGGSASSARAHNSHLPPSVLVSGTADGRRYAASPLYAWLLAGGLALFAGSPLVAASAVNALLLALILLILAARRRQGSLGISWLFVAVFLFGSVTFAQVFLVEPTMLAAALIAGACCLALEPTRHAEAPLPEVYDRPLEPRPWKERGRWASVGILLALAGTIEAAYWVLLVGAVMTLPKHRRRADGAALATGVGLIAVLVLIFPALLSGWAGGVRAIALGTRSTGAGSLPDTLAAPGSIATGFLLSIHSPVALVGHNLYYFLLGRNLGIVPYFFPVVLLLAPWRGGQQRWALFMAAMLAALSLIVTRPFDFAGAPACVGNRLFVPLFVALWFLPRIELRRGWYVAVFAASGLFLYPLWLSPLRAVAPVAGHWVYPGALAKSILPFEETQSGIPAPSADQQGISLKVPRGSLLRSSGPIVIQTERSGRAEVILEVRRPIPELFVETSVRPPESLRTRGARLVETMYRPDGRAVFRLGLLHHGFSRPSPRSGVPIWVYDVKLDASGPTQRAYALGLSTSAAGSWAPFSLESQ